MKSFFIKVFMMVAAALCMLEGLVLVAVGLGRLPSEKLLEFYNNLMATPRSLTTIAGVGAFFVVLGFILLIFSARTRPAPHVIEVEKDGKPLSIPEKAVRSFILQIIEQSPCASDVSIEFEHKGKKDVEISIAIGLDGVSSIYEELNEIEQVIKAELDRVFEWKDFTITFHLRGVGVDKTKKYFSRTPEQPPAPAPQEAVPGIQENIEEADKDEKSEGADGPIKTVMIDSDMTDSEATDDKHHSGKTKDKPHSESLFPKMLFGGHK
ncbi:MAG: hypothetical protein HQL12_06225 [Candidatus Omnitrophica bacterium]|nr:hypothetical protein [Candidatus Omnitrophota bacterium]